MSNVNRKQWFIATNKGQMQLPEYVSLRKAMHMAAQNSVASGTTELHDSKRLNVYVFTNGRFKIGREKVASTATKSKQDIREESMRKAYSPHA